VVHLAATVRLLVGLLPAVGSEVAENLADFFLLDLFLAMVLVVLILTAAGGGENHVINEFIDALAVDVV